MATGDRDNGLRPDRVDPSTGERIQGQAITRNNQITYMAPAPGRLFGMPGNQNERPPAGPEHGGGRGSVVQNTDTYGGPGPQRGGTIPPANVQAPIPGQAPGLAGDTPRSGPPSGPFAARPGESGADLGARRVSEVFRRRDRNRDAIQNEQRDRLRQGRR